MGDGRWAMGAGARRRALGDGRQQGKSRRITWRAILCDHRPGQRAYSQIPYRRAFQAAGFEIGSAISGEELPHSSSSGCPGCIARLCVGLPLEIGHNVRMCRRDVRRSQQRGTARRTDRLNTKIRPLLSFGNCCVGPWGADGRLPNAPRSPYPMSSARMITMFDDCSAMNPAATMAAVPSTRRAVIRIGPRVAVLALAFLHCCSPALVHYERNGCRPTPWTGMP